MKTVLSDSQQSLEQWVSQATGISTLGVKVQLRGNDLHILCEGSECPRRWRTLSDLLQALQQTDLDVLTCSEQSSIYQVFVYGRKKGDLQPQWCHRVYLNQLEQHLDQVKEALLEDVPESSSRAGALIISNESLARRGDPEGIARYLSETLSSLGVAVQVKVRKQLTTKSRNSDRLWIYCQSSYTPDPSLIAEPVAQKLRSLKLAGYLDAVIASQVKGETTPDWLLRIDLTPKEVMLKEWARWGDLQAITRLLNETTRELKILVEVTLIESTLHIFCTSVFPLAVQAPDKTESLAAIVPQLEAIAPQGILSATVYGKTLENHPAWIDWVSLPASEHPALATPANELASSGDEEAIIFLLERLLNPELELRLKTGGVRVLLLFKEDLLHIMCDAPVCPGRKQVAQNVTQFVRSLKISGIAGVRVYGRRAGNKEPIWQYGVDFQQRQRLIPEATPEFAATSALVSELLPTDTTEPEIRPNLTKSEVHLVQSTRDWGVLSKQFLLETQLFKETDSSPQTADYQGLRVALVWGALGLLLTIQTDWVLGQIIARTMPAQLVNSVSRNRKSSTSVASVTSLINQSQTTAFQANTSKQKSFTRSYAFNASEFTQTEPPSQKATSTAILLAARSHLPSFNTRQLDEQLALYRQRLAKTGRPPYVLIIGSSRALRGVDPAALSQGLAAAGYPKTDVFNFGINGATAQVVDFIIRHVLKPSELPKLILWADGSRAFNSGREDLTFKAIAASPGYKEVLATVSHTLTAKVNNSTTLTTKEKTKADQNTNSYQVINQWLNKALATVSPTYQQRDLLKNILNQQLKSLPIVGNSKTAVKTQANSTDIEEDASLQAIDFDGFLPLSVRFQPTKYYQKHPKVSGNFDNDYKFFGLQGEQDAALQTLLEFVQAHKISLVFVNMPLTADYLDPVRTKHEQEFQQYMLRLTNRPNFIYRDLNQLWPQANYYFSDPSHLNRYGAYEVSKKLANDPMIPWFSK